ncbi:MAG: hypothetical protein F4X47_12455 [Gammaproteobacteria bacterium]|nr:hypothetical protein [Gammaproteobacteria bacterium]MYC53114.1 hypothetical protein [Gammaproteobacteria bacterium]
MTTMAPLLQTVPILVAAFGGGGTMPEAAPSPQEAPASGSPVFSLSGDHRTRYERLSNQFRAGLDGDARALMLRTRVSAELAAGHFMLRAELQDSRSYLADSVAAVTTSMVNPLELLQAHIEIPLGDRSGRGNRSVLRAGRITMDIGSRRLVSRNRFRNTSDGFTGIEWRWTGAGESRVRAFYTSPVERRVSGNILDNSPRFDKEWSGVRFWGVHFSRPDLRRGGRGEVYYYGLDEADAPGLATADRHLHTIGVRLHRPAAPAGFDYEIESAFQFGRSRASRSATVDLTHVAHLQHIGAGYTFAVPGTPRLQLQFDHASGDRDPADGRNNRFSSLYGSRSFEHGPSGIHGAFARANVTTPGIRLTLAPRSGVNLMGAARGYWLASAADEWTTTGIGNTGGASVRHVGTLWEFIGGWELEAARLRLEAGLVRLGAGELMKNAGKRNATYTFAQTTLSF